MKLPRRFGRYELVERIAVGGTAEIYRAVLNSTGGFQKTLAIKTLLPQWVGSDELSRLLIDEAKVLCLLNHQSIVQVYELGDESDVPFMAMEYVDGIDCARLLMKVIRGGTPLEAGLVLYIVSSVLSALEFAHSQRNERGEPIGIVHRDVSPSNILISWSGEVKVTDFGIAKGSHRSQLTDAGQMRGKYSYMSPEQARGESVDRRSDIFACGIIMYELLTGRRLFTGKTDAEVLKAVESASGNAMELAGLQPGLASVLLLALAAGRDERYQTAGEMLGEVRGAMLAQGEIRSSEDLKRHLEGAFADDIEGERCAEQERREPTRSTRVFTGLPGRESRSRHRFVSSPWWRVAAILLISVGLMGTHPADGSVKAAGSDLRSLGTDAPLKGRHEPSMPGFRDYSKEFDVTRKSNPSVREIPTTKKKSARLYVGARPWGIASVEGHASPRETPISGIKVRAGTHLVTVSHPPSGRRLSRRVSVGEGQVKKCLADFRGAATLKCM